MRSNASDPAKRASRRTQNDEKSRRARLMLIGAIIPLLLASGGLSWLLFLSEDGLDGEDQGELLSLDLAVDPSGAQNDQSSRSSQIVDEARDDSEPEGADSASVTSASVEEEASSSSPQSAAQEDAADTQEADSDLTEEDSTQQAPASADSSPLASGKTVDGWRQGEWKEPSLDRTLEASGPYLNDKRHGTWTFLIKATGESFQLEYFQGGIMFGKELDPYLRDDLPEHILKLETRHWSSGRYPHRIKPIEVWSKTSADNAQDDAWHYQVTMPESYVQPLAYGPSDALGEPTLAGFAYSFGDLSDVLLPELAFVPGAIKLRREAPAFEDRKEIRSYLRDASSVTDRRCAQVTLGPMGDEFDLDRRSLRSLTLVGMDGDSLGVDAHLNQIKGSRHLHQINLIACSDVSDKTLALIASFPNLMELHIRGDLSGISAEGLEHLQTLPWLEELSLIHKAALYFQGGNIESLPNAVLTASLPELRLDTSEFMEACAALASLRVLRLYDGEQSTSGSEKMRSRATASSSEDSSSQSTINAVDSDSSISALRALPHLEELHLDALSLSAKGISALASLPKLRMLSLQDGGIQDAALDRLMNIPSLRGLALRNISHLASVTDSEQTPEGIGSADHWPIKSLHLQGTITAAVARHLFEGRFAKLATLSATNLRFESSRSDWQPPKHGALALPASLRVLNLRGFGEDQSASNRALANTPAPLLASSNAEGLTCVALEGASTQPTLGALAALQGLAVLYLSDHPGGDFSPFAGSRIHTLTLGSATHEMSARTLQSLQRLTRLSCLRIKLAERGADSKRYDLKRFKFLKQLDWLELHGHPITSEEAHELSECSARFLALHAQLVEEGASLRWEPSLNKTKLEALRMTLSGSFDRPLEVATLLESLVDLRVLKHCSLRINATLTGSPGDWKRLGNLGELTHLNVNAGVDERAIEQLRGEADNKRITLDGVMLEEEAP